MSVRAFTKFLASLSMFACASVFAAPVVFNVAGVQSVGEQGDPRNTIVTLNVGANAHIVSIGYDVNITAFGESYLSEISLAFTDSDGNGVFFSPSGDDAPGTGSYADFASLTDLSLDFFVGADGILMLEFFDAFDDGIDPNGVWNFGTITFGVEGVVVPPSGDVPEPASVLLLGAGLAALGYTSRRRRAATAV